MVGKRRGRHPRNDLDAKKVAALIRKAVPGRYFDGAGLHLFIKSAGSASWVLRISTPGGRKDYGLGGAESVSLADAREGARALRATIKAGGDPQEEKRKRRVIPTFEEVARSVHAEHSTSWRNHKHRKQWLSMLESHVFPELGSIRIDLIDVPHALHVLTPLWQSRPETARRVRQRIRTILDVAAAAGFRSGENAVGPVLEKALPRQLGTVTHHRALPYRDLPTLFTRLSGEDAGGEISRLALQLLILTATRTGEILGARRSEFDLDDGLWTLPATRMKSRRPHRIPLSDTARTLVQRAMELSAGQDLAFPGAHQGRQMSNMVFLMMLRRLDVAATTHGFRSSFRDWAAEATNFPAEVAEAALAHVVPDRTVAAYKRTDFFERRRKLMEAWASFVTQPPAAIIPIRAGKR